MGNRGPSALSGAKANKPLTNRLANQNLHTSLVLPCPSEHLPDRLGFPKEERAFEASMKDGPAFSIGVAVMSGSPLLFVVVAILYPWVYNGLIRREEKFLLGVYGQSFLDFCERVPRFFPSFGNWTPASGYDFGRVLKKHKEWRAWLAVCAVTAYLLYCAAMGGR